MAQKKDGVDQVGENIIQCMSSLKTDRDQFINIWSDAYRITFPSRGQGFINPNSPSGLNRAKNAQDDAAERYDSTLADANELLASSLISGLTPSNSNWLQFGIDNDVEIQLSDETKSWMQNAAKVVQRRIHNSNYDADGFDVILDVCVGGMAGLLIEPNATNDGFVCEYWPQDTLYCSQMVSRQFVDSVYREVEFSVSQAVDKFGLTSLPKNMQDEYADKPDSKKQFVFIHAIRPRTKKIQQTDGSYKSKQANGKYVKQMSFESIWVDKQSKAVVKESGYKTFPVVIPRYRKLQGTAYAEGPTALSLPNALTLEQVWEFVLINAEMKIAGTFVAKPDGRLNENTITIGPRKVVFAANPENIKPLSSGGDFQIAEYLIESLQKSIRKTMKSDQLSLPEKSGNPMSATEVNIRTQQLRRLLGPIYARMQTEFLQPLISRCYNIGLDLNWFGPVPDELISYKISPKFVSPMTRAAMLEDVGNIHIFEQYLLQAAQMNPAVLDLYKMDDAARYIAEAQGVPEVLLRSTPEVNKTRKDKQAAQQQAAQQQASQQALSSVISAQSTGKSPAYNVGA